MTTVASTKFKLGRILAAAAFSACLSLPAVPAEAQTYNPDDVAAIRAIAGKAGVSEIKAWETMGDPGQWQNGPDGQEITWSTSGRAEELEMNQSKLSGAIIVSPLTGLKHLTVSSNYGLTGITGLNYLTELTELHVFNTALSTLDVSKNTKLVALDLYNTQISTLDVSKNTQLIFLDASSSKLNALNVTTLSELQDLDIADTDIGSLNLSNNAKLWRLAAYGTKLTALDVSHNTNLTYLDISDTEIANLDLSQNQYLRNLDVSDTKLSSLNLSLNTDLEILNVANTDIGVLDLNTNNQLYSLDVSGLSSLNLATAAKLDYFATDQKDNIYGTGFKGTETVSWTGETNFRQWRDSDLRQKLVANYSLSDINKTSLMSVYHLGDVATSIAKGQTYQISELSLNLAGEVQAAKDLAQPGQTVDFDAYALKNAYGDFIYDATNSTLTFNTDSLFRMELFIEGPGALSQSVYYTDFFKVGDISESLISAGQLSSPNAKRLAPVLNAALTYNNGQGVGGGLEQAAGLVATADSPAEASYIAGQLTSETVSSGVQAGQGQVKGLTGLVMSHLSPPPPAGAAPAAGDGGYYCDRVRGDDWRLNFRLSGARGSLDGTHRYQGYDQTSTAGVLTLDRKIHPNWRVGAGLMIGRTELEWDSYGSNTKGTGIGAALFTRYEDGPFFAALQLNLGRTQTHNERGLPSFNLKAESDYDLNWAGAGLFTGYTFGLGGLELTPRLGLSYLHFTTDAITEHGAGDLNLRTRKQNQDSLEAAFDLELAYPIQTENVLFTPRLNLGVATELADKAVTTRTSFVSAPQLGYFESESADLSRTRFLAGAGLRADFSPNVGLALDYNGSFQSRHELHEGSLTVNLTW